MAEMDGFINVENFVETLFVNGINEYAIDSTGIFTTYGVEKPTLGTGFNNSGDMVIPSITVIAREVVPINDPRESQYQVAMEFICRSSIRQDADKTDINLYSAVVRYFLQDSGMVTYLSNKTPAWWPDDQYYIGAGGSSFDLNLKRVRANDPDLPIKDYDNRSEFNIRGKYFEHVHKFSVIVGYP